MKHLHLFSARSAIGSAALLCLALGLAPIAGAQDTAVEWSWRELGAQGWGSWVAARPASQPNGQRPAELLAGLGIQPSPTAEAVEMRGRELREEGALQRVVLWRPAPRTREIPRLAVETRPQKRAIASVEGRLLYLDRVFNLSGYTGAVRRLPLRQVSIQLVRSSDDSLMVSGSTDADGFFLLEYDTVLAQDLRLQLVSRIEGHPGDAPRVLDSAGPQGELDNAVPLSYPVLEIVGMGPGTVLDIGVTELEPAGVGDTLAAFNLLDGLLDVSEMLSDPAWLGAAPDSLPPVIWSPDNLQFQTEFAEGLVRVASPAGGDDDSWADALVLATVGEWYLQRYARVDAALGTDVLDISNDPRRAYAKGAGMVFASLVRQHRALNRVDADGAPADAAVSDHVDLGFPPPVGFPGIAQSGLDLETRELSFGGIADPRGQSSIANVAAMLWDLVDDEATPDGLAGDDDPRRDPTPDGGARFHLHSASSLPALPPGEPITYEDFHLAWGAAHGEPAALDSIAVAVGRTALFVDSFEDDSDPLLVEAVTPWQQPEPQMGGAIVVSEVYLGDRDWVELTNTGPLPVLLEGWSVVTRRNGFSSGSERETLIPPGVALSPGRSLVLFEGGSSGDNDASALHDPAWQIPWSEGEDGACILVDEGGAALDFLRWDGGGGPSNEPVPPGLAFAGALTSPAFAHSLARDATGSDSDQAADFVEALSSPYAPNAGFLQLRTLNPASDLDHLRLQLSADEEVQLLATAERDAPRPSLGLLDPVGQPVFVVGPRNGDEQSALLAWTGVADEERSFRLSQDADPLIASALLWGAWLPWESEALLPVSGFQAVPRNQDPLLDPVDLSWINLSVYDSLRLYVDGELVASLPGFATVGSLMLEAGHHRLELETVQNGVGGERTATGVFVGVVPRFRETGFEPGDAPHFDYVGFAEVDDASLGGRALLDHPDPAGLYPPDDEAVAEVRDPVDLTSTSLLRFRHAAHLIDDGDRARVELSLDDGVRWELLAEFRGTDHAGGGDPADWTDAVLSADDWVEESFDLSTFAGARVRVRFRRSSDSSGESLGWILDEIFFGSPLDGRVFVSPDGDDAFGFGHPERPFASVATGLAYAVYGDTLRLAAGSYDGTTPLDLDGSPRPVNIAPPPGVSIRGEGMGQTVIEIASLGTGVYLGPLTGWAPSDSMRLEGLTLRGGSRGLRLEMGTAHARDAHFDATGTGILIEGGELDAERLLVTHCGRAIRQAAGSFFLSQSTMVETDRVLFVQSNADSTRVERCLFNRIFESAVEVHAQAPLPFLACNDFYGLGASPEVFLGLPDPVGSDGNVAVDPEFCDPFSSDYTLAQSSPLLSLPGCGQVGVFGEGCSMTVVDTPPAMSSTRLLGNHPNPFNPRTRIRFTLANPGPVRLRLYDIRGRLVRELVAGDLAAGEHEVSWDATDMRGARVASGVYHLELSAEGRRFSSSMALLK